MQDCQMCSAYQVNQIAPECSEHRVEFEEYRDQEDREGERFIESLAEAELVQTAEVI